MVYYLTVSSGADEGKTFRVEGECLIGRSPTSKIVLKDETVAWEHVLLKEDGSKLLLQNLSAAGTKVKGRRVTDEVRVGHNDEIQLSDSCRVILEQRLGGGVGRETGILATLLVLLGLGLLVYLQSDPAMAERPVTEHHWRQAATLLDQRMADWYQDGRFPAEALKLFRAAWRVDQAQNHQAAMEHWDQLLSALHSIQVRFVNSKPGMTFTQVARPTRESLETIMGWNTRPGSRQEMQTGSDENYADALVQFVRLRAKLNRLDVEASMGGGGL